MYSASDVDELFEKWRKKGDSKRDLIIKTAEAELGWPYVWGAVGAPCSPEKRKYYANRSSCPEAEAQVTIKKCQALNGSGKSCGGCEYYPDNMRTLIDDCQGFVKQVCSRVGITFSGGGATSMWNGNNWTQKGTRDTLPETLCCIFWQASDKKTMSHIGFYIGGGMMIHCSGTVKKEKLSARVTHWAIPKGLDGDVPADKPTLRRGSSGDYVVELQKDLMQLGYDVGATGSDGKFGAKTEVAVKAFQANSKLTADGICGPKTWAALDAAIKPGGKLYTVTIKHLTAAQANALKAQYPAATVSEEG
jgi:cell wall-associated NlpC family hydrolase